MSPLVGSFATPDHQHLWGLTSILAYISLTHPCIGNAGYREKWGTCQDEVLCKRAPMQHLTYAWVEKYHVVVPFVSDRLASFREKAPGHCTSSPGARPCSRRSTSGNTGEMVRWDARLTLVSGPAELNRLHFRPEANIQHHMPMQRRRDASPIASSAVSPSHACHLPHRLICRHLLVNLESTVQRTSGPSLGGVG